MSDSTYCYPPDFTVLKNKLDLRDAAQLERVEFVMEMGFAPALIDLFERIEDEGIRNQKGFLRKYLYTHPPTALRIDKLERKLQEKGE